LIIPSRAVVAEQSHLTAHWRNGAALVQQAEVDMSIVVRMKVILSPPGLILKEKAPGGKRVHADGGLPSDRHPGFDAPKVSYPITKDRLPFRVDPVIAGRFEALLSTASGAGASLPDIVGSDGLHLAAMRLAMSPAGISPRACTSRTSFITGGETPKAAISCGTRRKALDPSA